MPGHQTPQDVSVHLILVYYNSYSITFTPEMASSTTTNAIFFYRAVVAADFLSPMRGVGQWHFSVRPRRMAFASHP